MMDDAGMAEVNKEPEDAESESAGAIVPPENKEKIEEKGSAASKDQCDTKKPSEDLSNVEGTTDPKSSTSQASEKVKKEVKDELNEMGSHRDGRVTGMVGLT